MDKENVHSIKNKRRSNKSLITKQRNRRNETEEKFVITTKNESTTKDNDLSNTYKNLDISLSNILQSFGNNKESQASNNLIKKKNNLNSPNNLIKQKNNIPKQSLIEILLNRNISEKPNEGSNQSSSLLLNKEISNFKEESAIKNLNKNSKKDSNKQNKKSTNSSKNIHKKIKIKLYSNSISSPCLSKDHPPNFTSYHRRLLSHENLFKIINNKNSLHLKKYGDKKYNSDFHDENNYKNKQKRILQKQKIIKNSSKKIKRLSKDNYNNYPNIIKTTNSIKTPKNVKNIVTHLKKRKNTSNSSLVSPGSSQSYKNSELNLKSERYYMTPTSGLRSLEKKNKELELFQRRQKQRLTFSNFVKKGSDNNLKIGAKKKTNSNKTLSLFTNKIQGNFFPPILLLNKPNEVKEASKIMSIITMDEIDKKIKESLIQYDKNELIKQIRDLETNEICEAIDKLPMTNVNNNSQNNDNKSNNKNEDNNNIDESNKAKYIDTKKKENNYNNSSKTKLMLISNKYRKLIHKTLVYDSLDDEEKEEIEINYFYIAPNSITVYSIDSIILISSLIQLLYLPNFLASSLEFCRNVFCLHQLIFYLIDLFYILDLITGFFRAYYNFDEFLIKDRNKICKKYLKNWFFIDFIEAIPIYIFLNLMENECKIHNKYLSNYYNVKINKLQYIFLLIKVFKIFKVISINTTFKKVKNKLNDYNFFFEYKTVLFTIFTVYSSLNISSCLFIFVGRNSYPGWIEECNMQNNSFIYIYLTAVYYLVTTVTSVGYGDFKVTSFTERIYQIIILIVGTCTYSYIISYISNYIKKIQEKSMDLEQKLQILEDIKVTNENFPKELYDKIRRYLQYNRVDKKNNNEILINCLPYPLKNNLFIEMYKHIIQNFKFFKSFENSNFIVKVVTSFKPVLSIKNDILIQEGDFIEDIIFVKEGILSLEICIDLNSPQESVEAYLSGKGFGKSKKMNSLKKTKKFETHLYSCVNSLDSTELKFNEIYCKCSKEKKTYEISKKYLRVLDIRKNEYFGDILMFLNERTPLMVKVKSKKAELFYLNKTDAIEISTLYPNIWKRIMQKSLFNMKQIKNLTRKILIYFSKLHGIFLDEEVCNDINNSDSSSSKSNFNEDSQIIENIFKSRKSRNKEKENEIPININNNITRIIHEKENKIQNNINDNISSAAYVKKNETPNNINNNTPSIIYEDENEVFESPLNKKKNINCNASNVSKKKIRNNIKNNKNLQLKLIADIEQSIKANNIGKSNDNESEKTEKISICNNINSFSDASDFRKYCCPMPNENDINSEIYPNENFNNYKFLQSVCSESNKNFNYMDIEKSIDKKSIIKNIDNEFDLNDESEKKYENDNQSLENKDKKIANFVNLTIVNTTNTTILSIYENINQITKYKFSRDINLRKKIIKFLMEESKKIPIKNPIVETNIFPKIKINDSSFVFESSNSFSDEFSKRTIKSKNSKFDEERPSMISLNKGQSIVIKDIRPIHQIKRNSSIFSKLDSTKHLSPDVNRSIIYNKNRSLFKNSNHNSSEKSVRRNGSEKVLENVKNKNDKKKHSKRNLTHSSNNEELNFYGKMKTMRGNNNNIAQISSKNVLSKSPKKHNYLDIISHNIFENRQTLKNPEEFYMGFFSNIVQKKINKRKKYNKNKKEVSIRNHKYLSDNNVREIKNGFSKRCSNPNIEMKQDSDN